MNGRLIAGIQTLIGGVAMAFGALEIAKIAALFAIVFILYDIASMLEG